MPLNRMARARRWMRALGDDRKAVALIEFGLSLPIAMLAALGGSELANNIVTRKRVAELAMMTADNASRMGTSVSGSTKQVSEADINEVLLGAQLSSGRLNLQGNGRVVLYSLEQNSSGGQWVRWARCSGSMSYTPSYTVDTGATGTSFAGMVSNGATVTATSTSPVMFVEVAYTYRPILPLSIAGYGTQTFLATAAVYVRDPRDLTQVYNPTPAATVSSC